MVQIGGIRSGKTVTTALWMIDRSAWDTAQMHCLAANTHGQMTQNILPEVYKWLDRWGILHERHRQAPPEWVERWRDEGIPTPSRPDRHVNILTLETGLHVTTMTLANGAYQQSKGAEWGSLVVDEVCHGATLEAIEMLFDRVGCGMGADYCRRRHLHQKWLKGNPPDTGDTHWIFGFLANLEKQAALGFGEANAPTPTDADPFPLLSLGVGDAILIGSSTYDNRYNLAHRFIEKVSNVLDSETAARRLGGALRRERKGRTYSAFTRANERPITYNPDRVLWVAFDFNVNPAVAVFAHPLEQGEYPSEHETPGVQHVGVWGEYFHVGGIDAYELARSIVAGERGSHGHMPSNWGGIRAHRAKVVAFGDATSGLRQMNGPNSWQIVDAVLADSCRDPNNPRRSYARNVPHVNPLVHFRVRALNAKLESATGIRSLWIDSRCQELIADFGIVVWNKDGTDLQKFGERGGSKLWMRTHISDALGYLISQMFPLGQNRATMTLSPKTRPAERLGSG